MRRSVSEGLELASHVLYSTVGQLLLVDEVLRAGVNMRR